MNESYGKRASQMSAEDPSGVESQCGTQSFSFIPKVKNTNETVDQSVTCERQPLAEYVWYVVVNLSQRKLNVKCNAAH